MADLYFKNPDVQYFLIIYENPLTCSVLKDLFAIAMQSQKQPLINFIKDWSTKRMRLAVVRSYPPNVHRRKLSKTYSKTKTKNVTIAPKLYCHSYATVIKVHRFY